MAHLNSIATQVLEFLHQLINFAGTCALIVISFVTLLFLFVAIFGFALFMLARAVKELDGYVKWFKNDIKDIECLSAKRILMWPFTRKRKGNGNGKGKDKNAA